MRLVNIFGAAFGIPEEGFLEKVRAQCEWRDRKATEYREDERNRQSAEGLEALGAWIEANPNAEVLVALDQALDRLYANQDHGLTPDINQRLGRYCFGATDSPEDFLGGLVEEINLHLEREPAGGAS
jgi:hypothetical protein